MLNEEQLGIEIRLLEEMAFRYGRLLRRTKKSAPGAGTSESGAQPVRLNHHTLIIGD